MYITSILHCSVELVNYAAYDTQAAELLVCAYLSNNNKYLYKLINEWPLGSFYCLPACIDLTV